MAKVESAVTTTYWQEVMQKLENKLPEMKKNIGDKCPHFVGDDGKYDNINTDWWVSGFWPGMLWIMYDMTGEESYRDAAWSWDETLEQWFIRPTGELHHDVGFQFLSTAVIKHKITGDEDALRRGLEAANFLAGRYNPAGKFIRAWNEDKYGWAIIDCMLNISLLFWASEVTGDPRYKHIAISHAETTMQYGVREDGSTKHILSFDPEDGRYIECFGGQGYAPESSWSRGTSWGLYGFANTYRYTQDERFLNTAKRIAHYFIAALPEDHVPYWDFRLPTLDDQSRDSSAAAIAASGLLELAATVPEGEKRLYADAAERILRSLTENYAVWDQPEHESILLHATGSGNSFIDVSLIYGDYYYLEAIAKLNGWKHRVY
ncbi:unsaturated chondroitin disaccharide hydrolase [Paenibacillus sp. OK060]|uniref:glycoside hydrolase family 88 protein n=1 Tax=Paenibacillus sp. OK060 TaxID=1881034 RepID=UPI00088E3D2A|nr:glycoside hydrolase family 88 protein [Paenibacillus sp. OK060]SDM03120.1 unsaturated chondroitin disaccharide hydrolase [Paenibacillus sp. OK060]